MQHGFLYTFPTPAAFFEAVLGPRQHDEHVRARHREMWLREREEANARAYAGMLADIAKIMARRDTPVSQACGEVQAYMAKPRHLRVVA